MLPLADHLRTRADAADRYLAATKNTAGPAPTGSSFVALTSAEARQAADALACASQDQKLLADAGYAEAGLSTLLLDFEKRGDLLEKANVRLSCPTASCGTCRACLQRAVEAYKQSSDNNGLSAEKWERRAKAIEGDAVKAEAEVARLQAEILRMQMAEGTFVGQVIEHENKEAADEWFVSKGYILDGERWCIAWGCRSGYDYTDLEFNPLRRISGEVVGYDVIIGHHASGSNPRMAIGRCENLADVQLVHDTIRRINGYPSKEEVVPSAAMESQHGRSVTAGGSASKGTIRCLFTVNFQGSILMTDPARRSPDGDVK